MIPDAPEDRRTTAADGRLTATDGRLSTRETAARLGVKPATVYAYVSRGQLTRLRGPGGRGSTFDPAEVDALAARSRREAATPEGPLGRLRTGITLLTQDACFYRGVDSRALAGRYGYEEVADWLWTGELRPGLRFFAPPHLTEEARRSVEALSAHAGPTDRLRAAVVAAGAADPLRFYLAPSDVTGTARDLLATLVDVLPRRGPGRLGPQGERGDDAREPGGIHPAAGSATETGTTPAPASLAGRLWTRLTDREPDPAGVRALDTALVLLLDHDLAASTLAARVAASARAHPYAVVSAGLGALDSPLHGAASGLAHRMLTEVLDRGDAAPVVTAHLRAGHLVPGLGHRLYRDGDPRAQALFTALAPLPYAHAALKAAHAVSRTAGTAANVDLALAVLSVATGMPADAGETVFAVARTGGWIAHALEEYAETPLRLRPRGTYTGPEAGRPVPEPR